MKRWLKSRVKVITALVVLLMALIVVPGIVAQTTPEIPNMEGEWAISCRIPAYYLDSTRATTVTSATLTIVDNTTASHGVITNATLSVPNLGSVLCAGFVGEGSRPRLSLIGSDGNVVSVINANVRVRSGVAQLFAGNIEGFTWHSGGQLGAAENATSTWSIVDSHSGSTSALLNQGVVTGSTYVQVTPPAGIKLSDLDSIVSGWGFWYRMQTGTAFGPQMELRFVAPTNVNPDGVGHVDVTVMNQVTGDGTWKNLLVTGAASKALYYGNDPWDGTAYDGPIMTLNLVETAINAEAAMIANGPFTCGDWTLSRVRIEVWEGNPRWCYVDDISVKKGTKITSYCFDPVEFGGVLRGIPYL